MRSPELGTLAVIAVAAMSLGLPEPTGRRRVLAGGLLAALALASLEVSGASQDGNQLGAVTAFAITIGILLFGLALALSQVLLALRNGSWRGPARFATLIAGLVVLILGGGVVAPLRETGGWLTAILTAAALALGCGLVALIGGQLSLGGIVARLDGLIFARPAGEARATPWSRRATILLGIHTAGALAAVAVPHLHLLLAVLLVSLLAGVLLERYRGRVPRWPVSIFVLVPAIGVSWYLLAHVAGGESLTLARLRDAPYSPAFEQLAALILGVAGWSLLGLWPFHGAPPGPCTPLLGALLFTRLLAPALPEGLAHWQPVLYLLAGLAAWHGVAVRRDEEALTALGALGVLSGDATAGWAGVAMVGGAALLQLYRMLAEEGLTPNRGGRLLLRALPLAGSALVVPVLTGALGAQVFYSVVTVAGVVTILLRRGR
jgi:hypothetical protein